MLHSRRDVLKSVFPPSAIPSSDLLWINGSAKEDTRWLTRHIFARPDIDPDQACHADRVRNENGCKKLCVVHPMDWADIRASWSEGGGLNITSLTRLHPFRGGQVITPSFVSCSRGAPGASRKSRALETNPLDKRVKTQTCHLREQGWT